MNKVLALIVALVVVGVVGYVFLMPLAVTPGPVRPALQFKVQLQTTAAGVNPSEAVNDETLTISADGLKQVMIDDRTDLFTDTDAGGADTAESDMRAVIFISNTGFPFGQAGASTWQELIKATHIDNFEDVATNDFPELVNRDATDPTQFDIDYAIVAGLDSIQQLRDTALIVSNYGEGGTINADAQLEIDAGAVASMILGKEYCITYLLAGVSLQVCLLASIA